MIDTIIHVTAIVLFWFALLANLTMAVMNWRAANLFSRLNDLLNALCTQALNDRVLRNALLIERLKQDIERHLNTPTPVGGGNPPRPEKPRP
jgi:hypothetical protein